MSDKLRFENGKYRLLEDGRTVLRHGEPWRDLTGDKFFGHLLELIEEQTTRLAAAEAVVEAVRAYDGIDLQPEVHTALTAYDKAVRAQGVAASEGHKAQP